MRMLEKSELDMLLKFNDDPFNENRCPAVSSEILRIVSLITEIFKNICLSKYKLFKM